MDFLLNIKALGIEGATLAMFVTLVGLLLTGMPLAFVTLLVALIFALGWMGPMVLPLISSRIFSFVNSFVFVSVPMFVLMAAILDRSGIARDLFDAMKLLAGRIRGGVALQTLLVAVILAAMSGIVGGEVILLGMLALPQMLRLGYDRKLAIGVCCAGGALGTMVPPSIVLIIYGLTANVSIGDLFTASFLPGFMLASFYAVYILFKSLLQSGIGTDCRAGRHVPGRKDPPPQGIVPACHGGDFRAWLDIWRHCFCNGSFGCRGGRGSTLHRHSWRVQQSSSTRRHTAKPWLPLA